MSLPPHLLFPQRIIRRRRIHGPIRDQTPNPLGRKFPGRLFALSAGQSMQLAPANPSRAYLIIENNSDVLSAAPTDLWVAFGNQAIRGSLRVRAGGNYETIYCVPTDSINVFAEAECDGYIIEA